MNASLDAIRNIVAGGLCHRCGSCAGICPAGVIEPGGDGYPRSDGREESCTGCGLCVRACPGISFPFPEFRRRVFGTEAAGAEEHGVFIRAYLGHANDAEIRARATSGGVGTGLPLFLLESGGARGAFAVVPDADHPWKPRAVVARSRGELRRAALSKYPACSLNHLFRDLKDDAGPFVFTGLPCHVHGLRKMAALDRAVEEKISLSIGLVCHSCLDHRALMDIFGIYGIDERGFTCVEYRGGKLPGYIRAMTKEGGWVYLPYPHLGPSHYRPNAKECLTLFFKFYSPPRCRLCIDAMAEFADVSIGDPWLKGWEAEEELRGGYSLVIARTERGLAALEEARRAGALSLEPLPDARLRASHQPMARMKKSRGLYRRERRRRKGLPIPEYGFEKKFGRGERARESLRALTYAAADRPALRRLLFGAFLSRPGRFAVGAIFFRRRVLQSLWERMRKPRA